MCNILIIAILVYRKVIVIVSHVSRIVSNRIVKYLEVPTPNIQDSFQRSHFTPRIMPPWRIT